jgi:hypothetical protein
MGVPETKTPSCCRLPRDFNYETNHLKSLPNAAVNAVGFVVAVVCTVVVLITSLQAGVKEDTVAAGTARPSPLPEKAGPSSGRRIACAVTTCVLRALTAARNGMSSCCTCASGQISLRKNTKRSWNSLNQPTDFMNLTTRREAFRTP